MKNFLVPFACVEDAGSTVKQRSTHMLGHVDQYSASMYNLNRQRFCVHCKRYLYRQYPAERLHFAPQ